MQGWDSTKQEILEAAQRANTAIANRVGVSLKRVKKNPLGLDPLTLEIVLASSAYSMISHPRLVSLMEAVRYVCRYDIPEAIVECGVWRGGAMMAVARTLLSLGHERELYLFDTFTGMSEPTALDVDSVGRPAAQRLMGGSYENDHIWAYASLEEVRANMAQTNYPSRLLHLVKGDVLETIPAAAPEEIAVLRLDTDWYESTAHELQHLVPRVSPNGVLLIDDYGDWQGARKAVDEFVAAEPRPIFLQRVDGHGVAVIPRSAE